MNFLSELYQLIKLPGEKMSLMYGKLIDSGQDTGKVWVITLAMIAISVFIVVCYYYVINHPRFNRWKHWLLMLVINFVINFLVSGVWVLKSLKHLGFTFGRYYNCPDKLDCFLGFGFNTGIWSIIFFIITSLIIKWWSSNCKYSPF